MEKLTLYSQVYLDDETYVYIKNIPMRTYIAVADNAYIERRSTGETMREVTLYKQLFDAECNELDEPIVDEDDYYLHRASGMVVKCSEVFGYEV